MTLTETSTANVFITSTKLQLSGQVKGNTGTKYYLIVQRFMLNERHEDLSIPFLPRHSCNSSQNERADAFKVDVRNFRFDMPDCFFFFSFDRTELALLRRGAAAARAQHFRILLSSPKPPSPPIPPSRYVH